MIKAAKSEFGPYTIFMNKAMGDEIQAVSEMTKHAMQRLIERSMRFGHSDPGFLREYVARVPYSGNLAQDLNEAEILFVQDDEYRKTAEGHPISSEQIKRLETLKAKIAKYIINLIFSDVQFDVAPEVITELANLAKDHMFHPPPPETPLTPESEDGEVAKALESASLTDRDVALIQELLVNIAGWMTKHYARSFSNIDGDIPMERQEKQPTEDAKTPGNAPADKSSKAKKDVKKALDQAYAMLNRMRCK